MVEGGGGDLFVFVIDEERLQVEPVVPDACLLASPLLKEEWEGATAPHPRKHDLGLIKQRSRGGPPLSEVRLWGPLSRRWS